MTTRNNLISAASVTLVLLVCASPPAHAAQCGSSAAGYSAWKQEFAREAQAKGIGASTISALMATNYAQATINADRGQRSFNLSLEAFLAKRGAATIVSRGRALKQSQAAMFASIQSRYGVPPGPLLAIWGMTVLKSLDCGLLAIDYDSRLLKGNCLFGGDDAAGRPQLYMSKFRKRSGAITPLTAAILLTQERKIFGSTSRILSLLARCQTRELLHGRIS